MAVVMTFLNDETPANPLEGVVAKVTQNGVLLVAATSGVTGEATVDVDPGTYQVIVSYPGFHGYAVTNPYEIEISTGDETYDFTLTLYNHPVAASPFCRCSGYFADPAGVLARDVRIYFQPEVIPLRYGNVGVFPVTVECVVSDGYASIDLIRGGVYLASVPGFADRIKVLIPDRSWSSLQDIVFPTPYSVAFDPSSLSMTVGDVETVAVAVTLRSGAVISGTMLEAACWPVTFGSSDESVVKVKGVDSNGNITATAVGAGSATITATRRAFDDPIYFYTDPAVVGSLGVTVTS